VERPEERPGFRVEAADVAGRPFLGGLQALVKIVGRRRGHTAHHDDIANDNRAAGVAILKNLGGASPISWL
jgi:hypothetical protein